MGSCRILTQDPDKILQKILWDPIDILQDPVGSYRIFFMIL